VIAGRHEFMLAISVGEHRILQVRSWQKVRTCRNNPARHQLLTQSNQRLGILLISKLVENSSAVILARLLEKQERFQEAHSIGSIVAAVSLRLYDQPLLLGDKGLTLRDVLFCLDELSQKNLPVHALPLRIRLGQIIALIGVRESIT
jgi:hypothetical protein